MKKSALLCTAAFLVLCFAGCEFLKDVAITIGRDVVHETVNTRLANDTTGTDSTSFELSYFPWFPAPGDDIQFRLRTDIEGPYTWDLGDGHMFISNSRIQTTSFSTAGDYLVKVRGGTSSNGKTTGTWVFVQERKENVREE